jgi:hypothetical protein
MARTEFWMFAVCFLLGSSMPTLPMDPLLDLITALSELNV